MITVTRTAATTTVTTRTTTRKSVYTLTNLLLEDKYNKYFMASLYTNSLYNGRVHEK
jgi:hypothetical protein